MLDRESVNTTSAEFHTQAEAYEDDQWQLAVDSCCSEVFVFFVIGGLLSMVCSIVYKEIVILLGG